jgi:AcrR family transcriptional regulator
MARWEPDARGRLLHAALDLFADQGYEATTAAQIARHAGLTKTTLFRLFSDKREVLFQGQPASVAVAVAAVESTPEDATALDALRASLRALCDAHTPEQQHIGRQVEALVESSHELHERALYKRATIGAAMERALAERIGNPRLAGALADLGIRAYYEGFTVWISARRHDALATIVTEELDALLDLLPAIATNESVAR